MGKTYAYRLEAATTMIENLKASPIGDTFSPISESQIRLLTKLSPEDQRHTWEKVIETASIVEDKPRITAKLVERIASEVTGKNDIVISFYNCKIESREKRMRGKEMFKNL